MIKQATIKIDRRLCDAEVTAKLNKDLELIGICLEKIMSITPILGVLELYSNQHIAADFLEYKVLYRE